MGQTQLTDFEQRDVVRLALNGVVDWQVICRRCGHSWIWVSPVSDRRRINLVVTVDMDAKTVAWCENRHQRRRLPGGGHPADVCPCGGRHDGKTTLALERIQQQ